MSNKAKDIDIKNRTQYFFNYIVNMSNFDPNIIKITSQKNILIYYIGYITIKEWKYIKINSINSLHLIFSKMNGQKLMEIFNTNEIFNEIFNDSKEKIKQI